MSLSELPPAIRAWDRDDKLRLLRLLANGAAREETAEHAIADQTAPIWSPHDAFDGAAALLRVLDEDQSCRVRLDAP